MDVSDSGSQTSDERHRPFVLVCGVRFVAVSPSLQPVHEVFGGLACSDLGRLGSIPCLYITEAVRGSRWQRRRCH